MNKLKISCGINLVVFLLVVIGVICMFCDIQFMGKSIILTATKLELFKFFTVDSNIFMGVSSLLFAGLEISIFKGKRKEIPKFFYLLKFMATVSVTLTFLVTLCFLVPNSTFPMFAFYQNSNLFFHLIVPILSAFTFLFFENSTKLTLKDTFYGLVPMVIYSIYYITRVVSHLGAKDFFIRYDFYGFLRNGNQNIVMVSMIILLITYGISFVLYFFHTRRIKKI